MTPQDLRRVRLQAIMSQGIADPNSVSQDDPFSRGTPAIPPRPPQGIGEIGAQVGLPKAAPEAAPAPDSADMSARTMDIINRMYSPDTTDRDRFRELLDQAPERGVPSWARTAAASAMSLKADDPIKTAEAVQYAPYHRDMADWTAKADPFSKAAQLENTANVNERALAGNVITAQTAADRTAELGRQADLKNEQALGRNRISMLKVQMGPGWKIDAHNGTTIKMYNPTTGEFKDTGMSTRWMNEEDKIDAEGEWRVRAAEASGAAAISRIQAAGGGLVTGADDNTYQPDTDNPGSYRNVPGLPPGRTTRVGTPASSRGGNPLDTERNRQTTLGTIYVTDADAKDYIEKQSNGKFEMRARPIVGKGGGWLGKNATQEQVDRWDEIMKQALPNYVPKTVETTGIAPGSEKPAPEAKSTGIGPSAAVIPKEPVKPASNVYNTPPVVGPTQPGPEPAFVRGARQVGEVVKGASATPKETAPNAYNKYGTRAGSTLMKNTETGEIGWITNERVAEAENSGRFVRTK